MKPNFFRKIIIYVVFLSLVTMTHITHAINISTCSNLNETGAIYYLTADIINSSTSKCINITANNVTLDCQGHLIDGDDSAMYGIYIYRDSQQTTNITIKNCVVTDWDSANIYLKYANGNTITNVTSNSSPSNGIYLYSSSSNTITNITTNSNNEKGIHLYSSSSNIFTNITANYNILDGILLESSSSNIFTNITANYNSWAGIYFYSSSSNTLTDTTASSNSYYGILFRSSSSNTLTDTTASSNSHYGIRIYLNSDNNIIANSTISNNTNAGLYLEEDGSDDPEYNTIYNCLFNNSVNVKIDSGIAGENYFNTTKRLGTRIYSNGNYIGGNYYTNSTGNGYSDICIDSNHDGFCDNALNLSSGSSVAWDYLPLSDEYHAINISSCTTLNESGAIYHLVADIINSSTSKCINITANDVTLDCQNHLIDGDDSAKYGIYIYRDSIQTTNIIVKNCIVTDWNTSNVFLHGANENTFTNVIANSSSYYGFYLSYSDSNNISSCIANSNSRDGFYLYYSDSNTFLDSTANSNNRYGFHLYYSNLNTISNLTVGSNTNYGIRIYGESNNNTIANSTISDNTDAGLFFDLASLSKPRYNKIYNNLFNNSVNVKIDGGTPEENYFNTTKQLGQRIYSNGDYIGGNYYTNSTGTGHSDTCTDSDSDGFCDSSYTLATSNIDYLPLSDEYGLVSSITLNSPVDGYNTTSSTIDFSFTVTGSANSYSCELFLNNTSKGTNSSTQNNTATIITASSMSNGTYSWYINCTAGGVTNQSEVRTITIDTTSPTTSASAIKNDSSTYTFNTWVSSSYINVTLSCSDSGSGCDTTLYCTDTSNSCTPNLTYTGTVQISTEGISYIRYRSNDTLGNLETTKSQTIKIDTTPPTTSASAVKNDSTTYTFNTWTNSSYVNVTLSCSDSGVGCDVTQYCLDTVNNCTPNLTYSTPVQISTGGVSYIRYKANDTVGNSETVNSQTIKIDIIKITESGTIPDPVEFAPKNFTIYVNATSSGTITNCNLSLWYEGNNTKVIDNKNMTKGQGGMWNYTHMADAEGTWNWSVICKDSYSQNTTASGNFSVTNNPPENLTCSFTPIPLGVSDSPVANGTGVDPEGADLTWSWTWWVNGVNVSTQKTLGAGNTSLNDNVTLQCFASDGYNQTTKNSSKITVGDTTPAIIENSSVSPTSGTVNVDSVKLRVDVATDSHINWVKVEITSPDGAKENHTMTLEANNTYLKSFVASDTGVYTFKAFALDGSGNVSSLTFTQNYTSNAASTSSEGGGGGAEPEIIVVERKEITTLTINIHPEVPIPPLTDQFPTHLNRKIKFKLINTLNNETILEGSAITDNKGNFLYKLPESIRKLKPGSFYNLTYYTPYGNVIKSLQVIIIKEKELWGVMPRYVIFKVYSPLQKKCADIRVLTGEKKNCPLVVSVTKDIEGKIEAERTGKGLKICVSGIDLKEDEKIIGKLEVSTSCFETKKYIDFQIVHTKCPDLGIPLLVGSVELFGVRICKLFFLLGNILFYCGALFATSYKVKNKKKFNWGIALIYTLAVNVFLFVVG